MISSMALCSRFAPSWHGVMDSSRTRSTTSILKTLTSAFATGRWVCAWNFSTFRANMIAVQARAFSLNMPSKECSIATGDVSLNDGAVISRRESCRTDSGFVFSMSIGSYNAPVCRRSSRYCLIIRQLRWIYSVCTSSSYRFSSTRAFGSFRFGRHFKKTTICATTRSNVTLRPFNP